MNVKNVCSNIQRIQLRYPTNICRQTTKTNNKKFMIFPHVPNVQFMSKFKSNVPRYQAITRQKFLGGFTEHKAIRNVNKWKILTTKYILNLISMISNILLLDSNFIIILVILCSILRKVIYFRRCIAMKVMCDWNSWSEDDGSQSSPRSKLLEDVFCWSSCVLIAVLFRSKKKIFSLFKIRKQIQ